MKQMVWHAYHAGSLCQYVDLEARRTQIEKIKSEHELPTRRRLMKPVVGQLPEEFVIACEVMNAARETWAAREAAYTKHKAEIEQLHAAECPDCPWNGETIFSSE